MMISEPDEPPRPRDDDDSSPLFWGLIMIVVIAWFLWLTVEHFTESYEHRMERAIMACDNGDQDACDWIVEQTDG